MVVEAGAQYTVPLMVEEVRMDFIIDYRRLDILY